ncbi:response regulator [Foetidibacter luteolus]|uniref:response regulator n=1 Tax=Foetidibacter luteolus TaxID=2608880 RepID=UPI00129BEC78|nr:response regulator [Foetidibacter luteolus]
MNKKQVILIVDDDEDDKQLFFEAVKEVDETIECRAASDGMEALKMLNDKKNSVPDYIFLDLRMPGIGGKKCLLEMRKKERLRNIPVIVYSTSTEIRDENEFKEAGVVHFISKPANPQEIYYLVSFVINEC